MKTTFLSILDYFKLKKNMVFPRICMTSGIFYLLYFRSDNPYKEYLIPIMIKFCAFVISTGGLLKAARSGEIWIISSFGRFLDSASLRSK